VARRATVIREQRAQGGNVLVLDAGNSLVGDADPAKKTQGQTSIAVMNLMGYDAMALGPQDLALGVLVLRQRIAEAQFAVLSANAVTTADKKPIASPYVVLSLEGHRVALVGLTGAADTAELTVLDPLDTTRTVVAELATQADIIILLSQAGQAIDQKIAEGVPGVDLIIGGGKSQFAPPWQSATTGTLILHADQASPGHAGRYVGLAQLSFDAQGQMVEQTWKRLSLGSEFADDPELSQWVRAQR
jgi:2',3'-cyclic-nucleotide 2'-phosphodiesterase (5'-nucleotidase family)